MSERAIPLDVSCLNPGELTPTQVTVKTIEKSLVMSSRLVMWVLLGDINQVGECLKQERGASLKEKSANKNLYNFPC